MLRYTLLRLASVIPTLALVVVLAFALVHAAPGGPFDSERAVLPIIKDRMEAQYGLDQPLLGATGDAILATFCAVILGPRTATRSTRSSELIGEGFAVSAMLGGLALVLGLAVGIAIGIVSALSQNRWNDHVLMGISMIGISRADVHRGAGHGVDLCRGFRLVARQRYRHVAAFHSARYRTRTAAVGVRGTPLAGEPAGCLEEPVHSDSPRARIVATDHCAAIRDEAGHDPARVLSRPRDSGGC